MLTNKSCSGLDGLTADVLPGLSVGALCLHAGGPAIALFVVVTVTIIFRIAFPAADGIGEALKTVLRECVEQWLRSLLHMPSAGHHPGDDRAACAVPESDES